MVLVLSLIAFAAFGAQTDSPPVISLNLEESVQKLATVQGHTCGGRVFPTAGTAFDSKPCESSTAVPSQQGQINHKSSKAVKVTTQSAGEAYGKSTNGSPKKNEIIIRSHRSTRRPPLR